jgi:hypothetical protein
LIKLVDAEGSVILFSLIVNDVSARQVGQIATTNEMVRWLIGLPSIGNLSSTPSIQRSNGR